MDPVPSVRVVPDDSQVRRGLRRGPERPEHQNLPLQDREGPVPGQGAHEGQGERQDRVGAHGAEGEVRREQQHPVGEADGDHRHPCGVRPREPEGPLQAPPGRPPGGGPPGPLHPHELGQLQHVDGQAVRGHLVPDGQPGDRGGRGGAVQRPDRLLRAQDVHPPPGRPAHAQELPDRQDREGDRGLQEDRERLHSHEGQRAHRLGHHRHALQGVAGRRQGRPQHTRPLLPPPGDPRGVGEHQGHQHSGQVPGALQDLLLRERGPSGDVHGVVGHDAQEPPGQGRGALPGPGPGHDGPHQGRHPQDTLE